MSMCEYAHVVAIRKSRYFLNDVHTWPYNETANTLINNTDEQIL